MDSKPVFIYPVCPDELINKIVLHVDSKFEEILKNHSFSNKDEEELLTVDETLKFLKCSKQALWNWRKNGILPSFRLGNRVYYRKSDIFAKLVKQE
ncbi:helix-turn-helix domain-containing protein [Gelidibacter mesophilus]|uniref:helix-turn-helix domain-containing protein n=1 Tax=Gelidibacter mesophilus TaxID=169050 RepID=UPI00068842F0|nr:helix-turn-helix domain-containing protein [Gelidibacter mesophilus]